MHAYSLFPQTHLKRLTERSLTKLQLVRYVAGDESKTNGRLSIWRTARDNLIDNMVEWG